MRGFFVKRIVLAGLAGIFSLFSSIVFANDFQYGIIVDAGSSGSRIHVYQYDDKELPEIKDIFTESTKPGLSSFASNPQAAGASLKKLFDDATAQLQNKQVDLSKVSVNVLGTAGMRLLSVNIQQAIYASVTQYLKSHYSFSVNDIHTISGQMEGLFGWLDANYLENTFQNHTRTYGVIDMGGASTEIAFATDDLSKPDDEISLKIAGKEYTVFSKSFLGMGQDQAREAINKEVTSNSCYPINFPRDGSTGNFNFVACGSLFNEFIKKYHISEQILPLANQKFIAYSGVYYTFSFFEVDKQAEQKVVEKHILNVCGQTWEQLQKNYPQVPEKYLSSYCASGIYLDDLLFGTYQLQGSQLSVKDVDWTLGAMLYRVIKQFKSPPLKK